MTTFSASGGQHQTQHKVHRQLLEMSLVSQVFDYEAKYQVERFLTRLMPPKTKSLGIIKVNTKAILEGTQLHVSSLMMCFCQNHAQPHGGAAGKTCGGCIVIMFHPGNEMLTKSVLITIALCSQSGEGDCFLYLMWRCLWSC